MMRLLLAVIVCFFSVDLYAACSAFQSQVTINEIYRESGNKKPAFIEIKLLSSFSGSAADYDNWMIKICHDSNNCKLIDVEDLTVSEQWLHTAAGIDEFDIANYLDFKDGFDIAILDDENNFIDYLQIGDYQNGQYSNFTSQCGYNNLDYVESVPNTITNGTMILLRLSDGTGQWFEDKNTTKFAATPGANNEGKVAFVDHYQIIHNNDGLTCDTETVTIKACTNSDTSSCTESSAAVTLDLLIDGTNDVTKADINFTGSTDVSFNYTLAEQVRLVIQNATVAATSSVFCSNASYNDTNCQMSFVDTGFRFLSDGSLGIAHQLSGKDSDTGYNAATIVIQAIEKNNTSGACQGVVINQDIEFAAQCTNPNGCSSALSVDDVDIPTSSASPSSYQAVNVGFNGSDTADIVLNYPDAGVLSLYARYNIPVNGSPSGSYMTGESSFTVRPFGFEVAVAANPKAEDATGNKFVAAGESFATTLTAKQWQAADDSNNDGIPDDGADLSDNTTVAHFSGESTELTHSLVKPVGGVIGNLSESIFDNFVNSTQTQNMSWDEVGIIRFDVNLADNDYFGAGDVHGNLPFVGRFTPAHYKQTVEKHGVLTGECGAWAYTGQKDAATQLSGAITYSQQPELIITAYASNGIDITKNFTLGSGAENFNKLSVASVILTDGVNNDGILNDKNQLGKNQTDLVTVSANWATATLVNHDEPGSLRYTFSDFDHYTYIKNANSEVAPFTAEIPLLVESITDSDGITQGSDASDLTEAIATGVEIRFARLLMQNSYGPETLPQSIPMQVEYLADSGEYSVNTQDNCTVIATDNNEMTMTDINLAGTLPTIAETRQTLESGVVSFLLTPQSSNRGGVKLEYNAFPWLDYDWNDDGAFVNNPTSIATFGLYRGNDRILQWREINP